jgi:hypothetical protein
MIEYDSKVIQGYADKLHSQAQSSVPMLFFIGLFAGLIVFGGITAMMNVGFDFLIISIGVLVGAFLGYQSGLQRAADLRLKAHLALCLIKIEQNSRG